MIMARCSCAGASKHAAAVIPGLAESFWQRDVGYCTGGYIQHPGCTPIGEHISATEEQPAIPHEQQLREKRPAFLCWASEPNLSH